MDSTNISSHLFQPLAEPLLHPPPFLLPPFFSPTFTRLHCSTAVADGGSLGVVPLVLVTLSCPAYLPPPGPCTEHPNVPRTAAPLYGRVTYTLCAAPAVSFLVL